jgi:hydrogenase expression/formation protein HypE
MATLAGREGLSLEATLASDTASLGRVVHRLLAAAGDSVHAMRDPTRGGVAAALNELAESSSVGIELIEAAIPIRPPVAGACEILGIDPLLVANEGKMLVAVAPDVTEVALAAIKADPLGSEAAVIGHAHASHPGRLTIRTPLGAGRILDMPLSDPLPRIC